MTAGGAAGKPAFLAPEVVQTSAMDCGPAALKCLLDGFGVPVSYGRLREVCQTDVDGTSIDTLEEVVKQLGLDAAQVMLPLDHFLLPEARSLPTIVVVRLPRGDTHFVVVWRRVGNLVQVMDPGKGRYWMSARKLLSQVYEHVMPVPAQAWREWAQSEESLVVLRRVLRDFGVDPGRRQELIAEALQDPGWRSLGALDAAARVVTALVRARALRRGREATAVVAALTTSAARGGEGDDAAIPAAFWSVRPAPPGAQGDEQLFLRGAVLVRARGRQEPLARAKPQGTHAPPQAAILRPELEAAIREPDSRPAGDLLRLLTGRGALGPCSVAVLAAVAAATVAVEALLFRGLLDARRDLTVVPQRLGALAAVVVFVALLWLVQSYLFTGSLRLGRLLDGDLRIAVLRKIPRLGDSYFRSRLTSDMADRAHKVHMLRMLPYLGGQVVSAVCELTLTTAGIIWLDAASAPFALGAAAVAVAFPLLAQSVLAERDMRVRTHNAALSRFYLDGLLGLVALRAHCAERSLRREHEDLLTEWARAGDRLRRAALGFEGVQSLAAFGLVAWLIAAHLARSADSGAVLLLLYWALKLPALGNEMALATRQYPVFRNVMLRMLEPLGAADEATTAATAGAADRPPLPLPARQPVAFTLERVSLRPGGHAILSDVDLAVRGGEHVAIVGRSGAGKTSLVGVLLGWHRPASGTVTVDGQPLSGEVVEQLRRRTAWVDPAVQLWNRSLLENLLYGASPEARSGIQRTCEDADLWGVIESLPEGLETPLGEGGGFISGGEGQRVRLGRALLRADAGLVILDEPFRGLDRSQRGRLLARARERWQKGTLLCITHDVGETLAFPRVVVVEAGRIVEDGVPNELAARVGSRYRALLDAEAEVRARLWESPAWTQAFLVDGRVTVGTGSR